MKKNKIKKYSLLIIPQLLIYWISYLKSYFYVYKNYRFILKNKLLKNKYFGESVYIFGNGPSLNNFEIEKLRDENIITMNNFHLHPMKDDFKIIAHCFGEPYTSETWASPDNMLNNINAETFWFNADSIPYFSSRPEFNINYYFGGLNHNIENIKGFDLSKVSLNYQSTSQMAINLAMYLGFKRIYMLGFDHDWLVTRGHSPHFYEEREGVEKADLSKFSYTEMIEISLNLFKIYIKIKKDADKESIKIYNLSVPTYLDVFPIKDN